MEAEVAKIRTESNQAIMDQYQEALDDLKKRSDERYKYLVDEFARRHEDLKADYERKVKAIKDEKDHEIQELIRKIKNLSSKLEYWKNKYEQLEK
jgi:DNA anti-recombination protein RmuC